MVELFTSDFSSPNRWLDYYAAQFDTVETTPSIVHGLCDTDVLHFSEPAARPIARSAMPQTH
jgi:hypothetical protein